MKRAIAVFGLLFGLGFGLSNVVHAGTPQETYYQGQPPLSANTVIASSASAGGGAFTLTVTTPSVYNSGGGSYNGRICITKFTLQVSTVAVVSVKDNNTTDLTIYGADLGVSQASTLVLTEDHLGPFCIGAGDQLQVAVTQNAGPAGTASPQSVAVEGYTNYGGTNNVGGPMY